MSGNVTFRLNSAGKALCKQIDKLKKDQVFIGFPEGKTVHTGSTGESTDMTLIAAYNEFGTSSTPARPFLKQTIDGNQDKIKAMCKKAAKDVADGKSAEQCLEQLGAFGVGLVQETIANGSFAPNSPQTVKKKGSDKPLIDTGQMRQSVHYIIRKKEGS